jgi:hypothetical protein
MDERSTVEQAEGSVGTDRRTFVGLAGAAVLGGVAALSASSVAQAQSQSDAPGSGVAGALEIERPAGLGPRAMLDNRFPASFSESVPKSVEVIVGYFTALNRRDLRGMAKYLHFPFASFEGTDPVLVSTPDEFMSKTPASMNMTLKPERFTDQDGYLEAGSYDVFRGVEVLCMDPVNCTLAMSYDRYNSKGWKLLRCDGVYAITNNDGHWAIQLMSTIFTPAEMIGLKFPEAEIYPERLRIDLDLAFQTADHKEMTSAFNHGATASSSMYGGGLPYDQAELANYVAMKRFTIRGVKTRLQFNPANGPARRPIARDWNAYYANYRALFKKDGLGNWGWVYGKNPDTRVIHQTFNKAHLLTGAVRFLAAGEFASSNYDVEIATYKEGKWGRAGELCYSTPHDRSNDVLRG